jgi:GntR family transcriptional regulator
MSTIQPLGLSLDFRSKVPIYLQIIEAIKQRVASGSLRPGDQLPTVRQMAADLRVNFNTVARAYRLLDEAGVISTQQGRGTYVLEHVPPEHARRLRQAALDELVRSTLADAAGLGYDADELERRLAVHLGRWKRSGTPPEIRASDEGRQSGA